MTNDEFFAILPQAIDDLRKLNEHAIEIAKALLRKELFKTDLYFYPLLNKSIQLTDGFIELIQNRNLTCAAILLRATMDNCLRLFAMYIANNPEEVVDCLLKGEKIDKLTDKNGNRLKDGYLKTKLGEYDDKFVIVYNNSSGYVHFSEKGIHQSVSVSPNDTRFTIQVSHEVPERANIFILECVQAYAHFLELFYEMFNNIIQAKSEYDKLHTKV